MVHSRFLKPSLEGFMHAALCSDDWMVSVPASERHWAKMLELASPRDRVRVGQRYSLTVQYANVTAQE